MERHVSLPHLVPNPPYAHPTDQVDDCTPRVHWLLSDNAPELRSIEAGCGNFGEQLGRLCSLTLYEIDCVN